MAKRASENGVVARSGAGVVYAFATGVHLWGLRPQLTAPPQPDKPPRPPQLVKGCLYRGPLLLGFDPCFNPTVDTMPALNLEDLTFEQVTEECTRVVASAIRRIIGGALEALAGTPV